MSRKPLRHGSALTVKSPDLKHSRKDKDFGNGFYTTNDLRMAAKWAITKMKIANKTEGIINEYEVPDFPEEFKILKFDRMDKKWLHFVRDNRKKLSFEHDYDIVIGPTADLEISEVIQEYEMGWKSEEETLNELKKHPIGLQILFHTERAMKLLVFKQDIKIDEYGNLKYPSNKTSKIQI